MKKLIIYYSHTGNNALLAEKAAAGLGADIFRLMETKPRTTKTIVADMIFNRYPELNDIPDNIFDYDLVIFMGPVWMYHVASPLRTCFKHVKSKIGKYAFVSMTGGALGPNTKISSELVKRLGKKLVINLDLNSAHLCTINRNPTTKDTGSYLLSEHPDDLAHLVKIVVEVFKKINK
ncbi:MAG: hypothetical protein JW982_04590 [Spirochaetes bacterium]|nr:hypothetical protein [Spirochaetota bacterium]